MAFVQFMNGGIGRAARVVAGLALLSAGIALGGPGLVLALVGLVPLVAGATGRCLLAPLFHQPLRTSVAGRH